MTDTFTLDDFDFELPTTRIAQEPARPRDSARLLEIGDGLSDRTILDLPEMLAPGDVLVLNNTKVIPARLHGKRGNARIEATLNKQIEGNRWRVFARPGRRLRISDEVKFGKDFSARVHEKLPNGEVVLDFETRDFAAALTANGAMPLPPYIERLPTPTESDYGDYQTIYAEQEGAIAAPTAGLHFTKRLFEALEARKIRLATVTLHVGAGTFLPVRMDNPKEHQMHGELGSISPSVANIINETRAAGGRIVAVGTTSLRLLESAAGADGVIQPFNGETDLFILPGYQFKAVDLLMTNFHLPKSTLFMLVAAFAGLDRMRAAYAHAVENTYRFYSYGDACLLHRG